MTFHCISLFPQFFDQFFRFGVISAGFESDQLKLNTINPRDFVEDKHKTVDDRPFGGGDGMVMLAEPLEKAVQAARADGATGPCIYLSPQGVPWTDGLARQMAIFPDCILVCGRYAGVDQRFVELNVDLEISVGDFVVSGGELPAALLIDSISRLIPGILGNAVSAHQESFANGLLECPSLTRPREFGGLRVPSALLSGDHAAIAQLREAVAVVRTYHLRPELGVDLQRYQHSLRIVRALDADEARCLGLHQEWLLK
jgi:tRNA (guanine37-N1)-methyltransferase